MGKNHGRFNEAKCRTLADGAACIAVKRRSRISQGRPPNRARSIHDTQEEKSPNHRLH